MQVSMKIDNLPGVKRKLDETRQNISDTEPLMNKLGNYFEAMTQDSFDNKKSPDGRKWDPLSNATIQAKKKKGKTTTRILYQSGELQDKFIYHSTRDELVVGTNANHKGYDYPAVHQFGTKDKKTPARTFMPFDINGELYDNVENDLVEIVVDFLEDAID